MDTFAFIIHPIDPKRDVSRKFPLLGRLLTPAQINFLSTFFPPVYISQIDGLRSPATGREVRGWFVACPLTPARMLELPESTVYRKIVETGRFAERLGAQILGLGAFTSVVGDAGLTISQRLSIPVTTGDSYTVAVAVEAVIAAARQMEVPLASASAVVLGTTGAVGAAAAELLAGDIGKLWLIGRRPDALQTLCRRLRERTPARVAVATDLAPLAKADLVLTVTSALDSLIEPRHLRPGAVVCDVARPRDVSARVAAERDDVLVIDGGMVQMPGTATRLNFDFGFPPGMVYACMAETMALALEGRNESFTLGRAITIEKVREIAAMASKHGFRLGGLRSFERAVTPEQIERVAARAARARGGV
ncbi:MAG: shikimate dehydrogenase [Anaerolineales bacterium]|nr:shikimate dehydrogenase [Anaerolineales bacterium]